MRESARNKIRYNVVKQDEEKLRSDSYKLSSYTSASESNPRDKFYRYLADRKDESLFQSSSNNETRAQVHEAVYTEYSKAGVNVLSIEDSKNTFSIVQGYNSDEQKVYNHVFERLKGNPTQTITFTEQQSMDLVSKTGMFIRNIKLYGSNIGVKNSYMPVTVIAPSDFQGYRAQLSSSGVSSPYDITKLHHEGVIKASMQGPFTNQHVGGYSHRHQPINDGTDNENSRPEMVSIDVSGNQINFTSPLGSTPDYSRLAVRFAREGTSKRIVNTKRIKTVDPRVAGNFSKNYEVFQTTNRSANNMWLRDHPTASFQENESAFISGAKDSLVQDFKLSDNTSNNSIIVQTFGAPGGPESKANKGLDVASRQFSPYNTLNYRNPLVRHYLNKKFLSDHSEYGNYTAAGFGTTASFHGVQRNIIYFLTQSGEITNKYDNSFVRREIPFSQLGYKWIRARNIINSSNDNNMLVKDYNDPGINFISRSMDGDSYFQNLYLGPNSDQLVKSASYSDYALTLTGNIDLHNYLISKEKLLCFSTHRQLSNRYTKTLLYTRRRNSVGDTDGSKVFKTLKHSPINSKYHNTTIEFKLNDDVSEEISIPFASNYAFYGDYYNTDTNKIENLYQDSRNIKFSDKSNSMFFRILDIDKQRNQNSIVYPKIVKIKYKERVWPKASEAYKILCYNRNSLQFQEYNYSWSDDENTRIFNSEGRYNSLSMEANDVGQLTRNDGSDNSAPNSGSVLLRDGKRIYASMWPMDVLTTTSGSVLNDQSGILMTLDNPTFISSTYPEVGFPRVLRSSRSSSKPYNEFVHFGRNYNINRPKNTVHETANSFPLYEYITEISDDVARNFKDYSTLTQYDPRLVLNEYYIDGRPAPSNFEFVDEYSNILPLNCGISEQFISDALAGKLKTENPPTIPAYEQEHKLYSDFVDLLPDLNKNEDLKISKIKFNLSVIKKFYPTLQFYPIPYISYTLARVYARYYDQNIIRGVSSPAFKYGGADLGIKGTKGKITPLFHPGIMFNSIKAGIGMPYSVVTHSSGNSTITKAEISSLTGSLTGSYYKVPWDTILDPAKIAGIPYFDADPDILDNADGSWTLQAGVINEEPYKNTVNNFLAEVVNTFIKDSKLPSLKSKPQTSWYFEDLNKDYSMQFIINKTPNFTTYSSLESFGHKPYIFHNPPWLTTSGLASIEDVTGSSFNSDVILPPSSSWVSSSYALATLTFRPSQIFQTGSVNLNVGKTAQISFNEIKKHTTVTFESSFITSSVIAQNAINLGDCVELFGFSDSDETWTPYVKWTCPTANLNFSGSKGKTSGSSTYDSGFNAGDAIRGIMHQLGSIPDDDQGLFFTVVDNSNDLTGSLAKVVGFDTKQKVRIGDVAPSTVLSDAIVIIPVYLENNQEERLLEISTDKFEKNYDISEYIKKVDEFSKKYFMPPLLDFMKIRRQSKTPLTRKDYGKVAAPFLMFFEEYKTVLTKNDLLRFWQGLIPEAAAKMEIDNKTIEFDLEGNPLFSYDDLNKFGGTLPKNLRFKVFKVYRRAEKSYQNIINRTLGAPETEDYSLTLNWPHGYYEVANMAKVDVELEYNKANNVPLGFHIDKDGNVVKDTNVGS